MRSIPNLLPLSGFYKGMTQKKISRKAAKGDPKGKDSFLSRLCVSFASLRETVSNRVLQCPGTNHGPT
jgi:hypothetical protein